MKLYKWERDRDKAKRVREKTRFLYMYTVHTHIVYSLCKNKYIRGNPMYYVSLMYSQTRKLYTLIYKEN